jgi:hypothetical protein
MTPRRTARYRRQLSDFNRLMLAEAKAAHDALHYMNNCLQQASNDYAHDNGSSHPGAVFIENELHFMRRREFDLRDRIARLERRLLMGEAAS